MLNGCLLWFGFWAFWSAFSRGWRFLLGGVFGAIIPFDGERPQY